jgi:hypothetical protein
VEKNVKERGGERVKGRKETKIIINKVYNVNNE